MRKVTYHIYNRPDSKQAIQGSDNVKFSLAADMEYLLRQIIGDVEDLKCKAERVIENAKEAGTATYFNECGEVQQRACDADMKIVRFMEMRRAWQRQYGQIVSFNVEDTRERIARDQAHCDTRLGDLTKEQEEIIARVNSSTGLDLRRAKRELVKVNELIDNFNKRKRELRKEFEDCEIVEREGVLITAER